MIVTAEPPLPNFRQYIDGKTEVNRQLGFPPAFCGLLSDFLALAGRQAGSPRFATHAAQGYGGGILAL